MLNIDNEKLLWLKFDALKFETWIINELKIFSNKAGVTICMIQLVWLNLFDCVKQQIHAYAQIFAWYNFSKIGWVLFLPTCMKEMHQSHFTIWYAELFSRKIYLINRIYQVKFLWEVLSKTCLEKKKWRRL